MQKKTHQKTNTPEAMTYRDAISYITRSARRFLPNKNADTVRIMEYVAEINEAGLLQNLDRHLTPKQTTTLETVVDRLLSDEPLEYIIGSGDFYNHRFYVSPDTLIPRVETETLVDLTIHHAHEKLYCGNFRLNSGGKNNPILSIVDVGTGSGCIIISTALALREPVDYFATDISRKALGIARKNIAAYDLTQTISVFEGHLLDPIATTTTFDIITANLPYISESELPGLQPSVRNFEPEVALVGGLGGEEIIGQLLGQTTARLRPGGVIILEIKPNIADTVTALAARFLPKAKITVEKDTFEVDRIVLIRT